MAKPTMPNIPGIGAMTDTIDFVKNLWGSMGIPGMNMSNMSIPGMPGMNIPGMVMPTLSVEEIQKKITDLKAVESWLNLNMGMLRSTIQALEVQAATLSTLQTMGESFTASMASATQGHGQPAAAPVHNGNGGGNGHATEGHGSEKLHHAPEPTSKDQTDAAALTAPLVNAAAWWNMLQEQFKQAVDSAMTTEPLATAASAEKPKARPKAKASAATAGGASTSGTARKRKTSK
ncbi:MAG TPA: PhaM family polyhydroxyalkanoate granule multifunctional regulatory protein [Noviherbaspirillum sp.]|uniref:PhaM family polyhydroxyalkanoate granule multifunctional regulatory protein n=1 Tax=Noviherbaspirillum sp. TaxID=1926288 RepID=UPI002B4A387A|nr:PhaM family polyhydroxyalkanoate granule multifunctional regulatory protein [Noviherbaspirillum sp.]HJV87280.1 PhaM family polyhydroxyalkanoate granule multifunctional regulatory protein [Noviherbaspirillum sp.]